jgi:hypothetical protein
VTALHRNGGAGIERGRDLCRACIVLRPSKVTAAREPRDDALAGLSCDLVELLAYWWGKGVKDDVPVLIACEDPVEHDHVKMHVQIDRGTKALDEKHRPAARVAEPVGAWPMRGAA